MADVFFAIMFIALLLLILGLIKPKLAIYWGKIKTRKQVALIYTPMCIVAFIVGGIFVPPVEHKEKAVVDQPIQKEEITQEQNIEVVKQNDDNPLEQVGQKEEIKPEVKELTPLEQMLIAFDGNYKMDEIRDKVIKAMTLYNVELTDENYSRVGSSLVGLRKSFGVKEMDILDYMIDNYTPNLKVSFPDMAGIATAILAKQQQ